MSQNGFYDIKRHENAEHGRDNEQYRMVVMGIAQALVNKIADHAHQHSGKDSVNQFQVGTHLSLSHRISFLKNCGCVSDYCNLFAIFLETFIYLRRAKYLTKHKTALKCFSLRLKGFAWLGLLMAFHQNANDTALAIRTKGHLPSSCGAVVMKGHDEESA